MEQHLLPPEEVPDDQTPDGYRTVVDAGTFAFNSDSCILIFCKVQAKTLRI